MRRNIILFDLDGTLTDSGPGIMKAGQYALRAFGIERDWRELSFFVGPPLSETFAHFVSAENVDAAVAKFREYYQQDGWLDNAPYPGIPALLAHLKSEGKRLFVATSKLDTMAERILEHFGLAPYFDAICGAPEGDKEAGKKVNVVKAALKAAGCDNLSRAVMVGDREHDVIGAHLAGLDVIGAQADMAASLKTTVESLQVLTWAGELAGVSMGEIEQATKKLTTRLSEAATGSGSAVGALQRLNLSATQLQALPLDQRIVAIQEALNRFVPEAERAAGVSETLCI